jgi:serine/threonine protein kinase
MTVIGHGTYGCIYRPPIKCSKKTRLHINYKNKISKLLSAKNAQKEYDEYSRVSTVDKNNEYHLGKPIICEADPDDLKQKTETHECKKYNTNKNAEEFKLLISDYGGITLTVFCDKHLSEQNLHKFFFSAAQLLKGLELFSKNGIIHRDIKPGNILWQSSGKLVFIDFGLTEDIDEFIKKIKTGEKTIKFHWSYPLEYGLASEETFNKIIKGSDAEVDKLIVEIQKYILNIDYTDDESHIQDQFEKTFELMNNKLSPLNITKKETLIFETIYSIRRFEGNYNMFLESMVKSMDTYAMGFTLNYVLNSFYDQGIISEEFYKEMHSLFESMFAFDINERLSDISEIRKKYENIIGKHKIMNKNKTQRKTKTLKGNRKTAKYDYTI